MGSHCNSTGFLQVLEDFRQNDRNRAILPQLFTIRRKAVTNPNFFKEVTMLSEMRKAIRIPRIF